MSLYILCLYNGEESHLSKSIKNLKKISDKVYIFSSKENMDSAIKFADEDVFICELEWNHDFSELRNKAIDIICKDSDENDWILSIDADEYVDINNYWKLNSTLDMYGRESSVCGFEFEIINNDKYWPSDYCSDISKRKLKNRDIRVFRTSNLIRYSGRINEKISINPALISSIDLKIYHHANRYTKNENDFLSERERILEKWNIVSEEDKNNFFDKEEILYKQINILNLSSMKDELRKPRFGFFCLHYDPPMGGAERSMHNYFSIIKDEFIIDVFCFLNDNGQRFKSTNTEIKDGINLTKSSEEICNCVNKYIREKNPDIIGTQLLCSEQVVEMSYKNDIPVVYFSHGLFEDICQHYLMTTCPETNLETCSFGSHCPNAQRYEIHAKKYSRCSKIFCNSHYTESILKRFFPSESEKIVIIPPNFRYELYKPAIKNKDRLRNRVLAVNTASTKGRNVVINLAFSNPDLRFIYVDSKPIDLARVPIPPNIEFRPKASNEDMAKIYNDVDVVLCPTLMYETFGGVVCEAVLSGTPVICAGKGNLPNIVSNGKNGYIIYNDYTTETWKGYLRKALEMDVDLGLRDKILFEVDSKKNSKILSYELKQNIKERNKEIYFRNIEKVFKMEVEKGKKNILFLGRFGYPALGGGEHFIHTVLKHLKSIGYHCEMACYFNGKNNMPFTEEVQTDWDGIPVKQAIARSYEDFKRIIEEKRPDLVITQSYDAPHIVKVAKEFGAKTILGKHFWRNICDLYPPEETFLKMLSRPKESVKLLTQNHVVFDMADECYVNSKFMQMAVEKYVGKKIDRIIHPMADIERILAKENTRKYVTLINPDYYKGGDFFIKIAEKMLRTQFLCVGLPPDIKNNNKNRIIHQKLNHTHNIKVIENNNNIKEIYGQTSILLIPSIVDETFSMVALEAMYNGIPVIASSNGNLPYLIEDASLVLDMENIDTWVESIRMLLSDEEYYQIISKQCKNRAMKFSPEKELDKFAEMVKILVGEPNWISHFYL